MYRHSSESPSWQDRTHTPNSLTSLTGWLSELLPDSDVENTPPKKTLSYNTTELENFFSDSIPYLEREETLALLREKIFSPNIAIDYAPPVPDKSFKDLIGETLANISGPFSGILGKLVSGAGPLISKHSPDLLGSLAGTAVSLIGGPPAGILGNLVSGAVSAITKPFAGILGNFIGGIGSSISKTSRK